MTIELQRFLAIIGAALIALGAWFAHASPFVAMGLGIIVLIALRYVLWINTKRRARSGGG